MLKSNKDFKKIILIAGPTASGKSKIAIALAKKINGEIINADSMQVYKEISVLSARPENKDLKIIKHHLYGFLSVKKNFSVGQWLKLVKKKIDNIISRGKVPILVGGTGLYFNAITKGLSKIPVIQERKRGQIRSLYKKIGRDKFYKKLLSIDPKCKNKILPFDTQRILRAYEVKKFTNKSLYDWMRNTKSEFNKYTLIKIYLDMPREKLLKRIYFRTTKLLNKNCFSEVKNFNKLKIKSSLSVNKIIGIKEIKDYLAGNLTLSETEDLINIRTRQYAKRQSTWARGHMKNWNKLYNDDFPILFKKILKHAS